MIINKYFKSKLFLSSINLDGIIIEKKLDGKIDKKLITELIGLIKLCDSGRYGPDSTQKMDSLQANTINLLKRIDKELI